MGDYLFYRVDHCSSFRFTGIAVAAAGIAKILFFVFLIIFIVFLIMGLMGRRPPPA
jgi:uncharacterized membrane protein YtjA (UPF0391 family)